jgi:hypothetical protein
MLTNPSVVFALQSTPVTYNSTQTVNPVNGDLPVSGFEELAIDVNVTAFSGNNANYKIIINRKGADGVYYPIYTSNQISSNNQQISVSIGRGMSGTNGVGVSFAKEIQILEVFTTTGATPLINVTRSISVIGK